MGDLSEVVFLKNCSVTLFLCDDIKDLSKDGFDWNAEKVTFQGHNI